MTTDSRGNYLGADDALDHDGEPEPDDMAEFFDQRPATSAGPAPDRRTYMDNPKAVGAPANARWGYLPCGCTNDGYGRHVR
jgi:hypothetical protein